MIFGRGKTALRKGAFSLTGSTVGYLAAGVLSLAHPSAGSNWEFLFSVTPQYRWFVEAPQHPGQGGSEPSLALRAEIRREWNDGADFVDLIPFFRWDGQDPERTHADVREASWTHVGEAWQMVLGISKVFWGVTESQHLVDIINQTDLIENPDAEEKLGQPMLNLTLLQDWGTLDFFVLGGFRERTFPGKRGRLRTRIAVDDSLSVVERSPWNLDLAARWSDSIGDWDLAVSHFWGTSREPLLVPDKRPHRNPVLRPVYPLINQTGLEAQFTHDAWLWKLEAIRRSGAEDDYYASVFGFEHTRFGVFDTNADLGLLAEYHFDTRGRKATTGLGNDLFVGTRWVANDVADTNVLVGGIFGLDSDGDFLVLEGSRRLGDKVRVSIDGRYFFQPHRRDAFFDWRGDSFVQVEMEFFF